jgi:hypothetical protein
LQPLNLIVCIYYGAPSHPQLLFASNRRFTATIATCALENPYALLQLSGVALMRWELCYIQKYFRQACPWNGFKSLETLSNVFFYIYIYIVFFLRIFKNKTLKNFTKEFRNWLPNILKVEKTKKKLSKPIIS